jgi:hypothetical protein
MNRGTIERVREAPIELVLNARGFRFQRNRWLCHAHDDRRPSATVHNNRLHCWVCDRWWSNIDLIQELDGASLSGAVRSLAELYGIAIDADPELTTAERKNRAEERRRELIDRQDALCWGFALIALSDETLEELSPTHPDRSTVTAMTTLCRHSSATLLVAEYRAWRDAHPTLSKAMAFAGEMYDRRTQVLLAEFVAAEAWV